VELIEELLEDDLRARASQLTRQRVVLGLEESGKEILVGAHDFNALLFGTSGGAQRTLTIGLLERLTVQGYNFCVIDSEGYYDGLKGTLTVGTAAKVPTLEETQQLLNAYDTNFTVNLAAVKVDEQPKFFLALLSRIQEARSRTGRPHWLLLDQIHHLLPADLQHCGSARPTQLEGVLYIGTPPRFVVKAALKRISSALAIGKDPQHALGEFSALAGIAPPPQTAVDLKNNEALYWSIASAQMPRKVTLPARGLCSFVA